MLKDLMQERSNGLAEFRPDLDAIVADGDRRVRRRRVAGGAIGVAAVVALVAATPAVMELRADDDQTDVTVGTAAPLTWAEGSTIHAGGESIDVGHEVHAFVETDYGYVFADESREVWTWADGSATAVGHISEDVELRIVADGKYAAWIDDRDADDSFIVLEGAGGAMSGMPVESTSEADGGEGDRSPTVFAIDGTRVFAIDDRGVIAIDATGPSVDVLAPGVNQLRIHDAEDGLILFSTGGRDGQEIERTHATRDLAKPGPVLGVDGGDLSPDGRLVMSENSAEESDTFTLLEVETGKELTPAITADYGFFLGYAWIDNDSYTAFGMRGFGVEGATEDDIEVDLLVCHVSDGSCTVGGQPESWRGFQVPIGQHIVS